MMRRINYTGRVKIARSRVHIRLHDEPAGRCFDAEIDLRGLKLPSKAAVFVEAYHRTAYQRWAFGTVAALRRPDHNLLERFATARPLFRVKVVDQSGPVGRILAAADRIVPLPSDEDEEDREPLLVVEYAELEDGLWKLDLDGDWPTLTLNSRVDSLREAARSGPEFLTLVYPEVVRCTLRHILLVEGNSDPDCNDDEWSTLWLRFACAELGCERPPDEPDVRKVEEWIERAVAAFCNKNRVVQRAAAMLAGGDG